MINKAVLEQSIEKIYMADDKTLEERVATVEDVLLDFFEEFITKNMKDVIFQNI